MRDAEQAREEAAVESAGALVAINGEERIERVPVSALVAGLSLEHMP